MDSASWDLRYREAGRLWGDAPNLFVADRLAHHAPGRGVDLAAGAGRNAIWLAEEGWEMTAVDFSEVAVARGRERSERVRFVVADVTRWEPDTGVDLVLIAYLHLHPGRMETVVRRAPGWLTDGGELFMVGHDRSNLERGHGGPQEADLLWSVDVFLTWVEGLTLIEAGVVRRPVETDSGVVFARDALIRVRR